MLSRTTDLLAVGVLWLVLMLAFEVAFGRFVVGASWDRPAADYNVLEGGLLPFGMLVLLIYAADCREAAGMFLPGKPGPGLAFRFRFAARSNRPTVVR